MDSTYYHVPCADGNERSDYQHLVFAKGTEKKPGWLTDEEMELRFPPATPRVSLEDARGALIAMIDMETASAILAGFEYEIGGQTLHFSYDFSDQQNFADTANASVLAKMGVSGVPESVLWNGWDREKDPDGNTVSRSPVLLVLDPDAFLALYTGGALAHKAARMEAGRRRKAAALAARSLEELAAV